MAHPASVAFYQSAEWKRLRAACLERDRHICTVQGCGRRATHVDHIKTRPHCSTPTAFDVPSNLRSLCSDHDSQVKELPTGGRRRGGEFAVRGTDAEGWPRDPRRHG